MPGIATTVDEESPPNACSPERGAGTTGFSELADRVREAIESAGLTLYQVSARTDRPRASAHAPGVVGHTLYRDIRAGHVPTVQQLASLSWATHRPLARWLALVGVDVSRLASLQRTIHPQRTIPLASRTFDPLARVTIWNRKSAAREPGRTQRLADLVEGTSAVAAEAMDAAARPRFLYLSVGTADPWRAAEVAAGSLVRVDPRKSAPERFGRRRDVYAVAHAHGVSCCYVDAISRSHIAIFGESARTTPLVCRLGDEAAILGRVDAELRFVDRPIEEQDPDPLPWRAGPVALPNARCDGFGRFLRCSRSLIGLTFRDAHALAGRVAAHFDDERFRISLGALSNYETLDALPPSAHTLFSLAAIYAIDFWILLSAGGLRVDGGARVRRHPSHDGAAHGAIEWPILLEPALHDVASFDPENMYVWGSAQRCLDPRLEGAVVVAVNRDNRRLASRGPWAHSKAPLFVLRLSNDAYIGCAASLHDSWVIVHPSPTLGVGPSLIPREHVEVVGKVSAILRRVGRSPGGDRARRLSRPRGP